MTKTHRRKRKSTEPSIHDVDKTVNDVRSESKSKEQMKRDYGSPRSTMNRKLGKR